MSNIPLARQLLVDVRQALLDREETGLADMISEAIDLMHRRRAVRRMRAKSPSITADLRQQIIHLASTTEMHAAEIAVALGVNPGRVSEVLQRLARIN